MERNHDDERRGFLARAAYVTPALLTFPVSPSYAKEGSEKIVEPPRSAPPGGPADARPPRRGPPPWTGRP